MATATKTKNTRAKKAAKQAEQPRISHPHINGNGHQANGSGATVPPQTMLATPPGPDDLPTAEHMAKVAAELQALQRQRAVVMKSRIMQSNRLTHVLAGELGYRSGLDEKERRKLFDQAAALIKAVLAEEQEHKMAAVIRTTYIGIDAFLTMQRAFEASMVKMVKTLPAEVVEWVQHKNRRGFSLLGLAIVVGEAGDIGVYSNPGKLWKRMGCAPYQFDGKTAMGATWRAGQEGKLPADEWAKFGYSPRRRSISYLIGEGLVKQNGPPKAKSGNGAGEYMCETEKEATGAALSATDTSADGESSGATESTAAVGGPYRARYDRVKMEAAEKHADWTPLRCHRHAMLLATKQLLKELWIVWRKAAGTYTPDGDWEAKAHVDRLAGRHGE